MFQNVFMYRLGSEVRSANVHMQGLERGYLLLHECKISGKKHFTTGFTHVTHATNSRSPRPAQ
jgi:hypothetical protein